MCHKCGTDDETYNPKTDSCNSCMPNLKSHKHAALIKAWADGAEIQYRFHNDAPWIDTEKPVWELGNEYRIKPKTIKYRQYLVRYDGGNIGVNSVMDWEGYQPQMHYRFLKWLGDWQEVEV